MARLGGDEFVVLLDDLGRDAGAAMYHAKARGRNGVALFEPGMLRDAEQRLTLERDLGLALDHGELSMHLQLQVDGVRRPTRMPLYELKIDKGFIRDTPHDKDGSAIVQSILAMAGHLGLRVVAEGVETEAQVDYLARHGGACMQGYLFRRPMPLDELLDHLCAA